MKMYMPSDVHEIIVGKTNHRHTRAQGEKYLTIDCCEDCTRFALSEGGANNLANVRQTYDEKEAIARAKIEGDGMMKSMMDAWIKNFQENQYAPRAEVAAQIPDFESFLKRVKDEVRAELLAETTSASE